MRGYWHVVKVNDDGTEELYYCSQNEDYARAYHDLLITLSEIDGTPLPRSYFGRPHGPMVSEGFVWGGSHA